MLYRLFELTFRIVHDPVGVYGQSAVQSEFPEQLFLPVPVAAVDPVAASKLRMVCSSRVVCWVLPKLVFRELMTEELQMVPELRMPPGTPISYQESCGSEVLEAYLVIWERLTATPLTDIDRDS